MVTAKEIDQYINDNLISKNTFCTIKDEPFVLLFGGENEDHSSRLTFSSIPKGVPYKYVLVGTTITDDNLTQSEIFNQSTLSNRNLFFLGNVEFNGLDLLDDFILNVEGAYNASVSFKKCYFKSKVKIRNMEYGNYKKSCKNKTTLERLKFINCEMHSSKAYNNPFIRVGFLDVNFFVLKNLRVPAGAEVNIGDCHFKNFRLSNFRNLGKFKLYKINVGHEEDTNNGTFQLDNTSIGDTDFQSLNLVSFKTRKIFDNILSGIDYTNVKWEKPETDIQLGQFILGERITDKKNKIERKRRIEKEKRTRRAKKRDTYRVLKNVAQTNNDMPQAFAFHIKEMQWHRELIKGNTKLFNMDKLKRLWVFKKLTELFGKRKKSGKLLDRIILEFGYHTNRYGQDWFRPMRCILFSGILAYAILLWVLTGDFFSIFKLGNWKEFFVFLNPTHAIKPITVGCWGFSAYTIDFSFRVWESALIYQTIQAFRKYSRKF